MNIGWLIVMYFAWVLIALAGGGVNFVGALIVGAIATAILTAVGYYLK